MSKFVLTAQLQLQAPKNVGQVASQIQSQLNNVSVNVNVQNAGKAAQQVQKLSNSAQKADSHLKKMGKSFGASVRRFSAMAIATRAVTLFTNTLGNAIKEAIDFERELIKVSQVTGKTMSQLKGLKQTIDDLATSFGVSSTSILGVARILSQAGLSAGDTRVALDALAKTELAPTFENITQTAEGAVAILNQFKQGAGALEAQLGSLNAVAGKFAVESGDLIAVIRRTGGVFKAAGGDLNELIALFTSVRATTRESAESIATGLRTIFTRIQRPKTIEFLKQYGIELTDLEGKFVGPYEAVRRLSGALAGLEKGDLTFIQIAEELGGFRQIGKVLPLINEFATANAALKVAQEGQDSLATDAAKAQLALAVQINKVKEEFLELVRATVETPTFQVMAQTALAAASALIKVAEALKPILPIITAIAAVKFTQGIAGFLGGVSGGFKGGKGFNSGGRVHAFATGGVVPGTGNTDTVPAMLTPGEFVIRKSSVQKLGTDQLHSMNKYAKGGIITDPIASLSSSFAKSNIRTSNKKLTK
ncbi:MAG: phage tail tape measure protein, partial [Rickettsiales bacterium TMED131]